jgi:hypothetical protein
LVAPSAFAQVLLIEKALDSQGCLNTATTTIAQRALTGVDALPQRRLSLIGEDPEVEINLRAGSATTGGIHLKTETSRAEMANLDLSIAPGVTVQKIGLTGKIELHETETTTILALRNAAEAARGLVRLDLGKLHEASPLDP